MRAKRASWRNYYTKVESSVETIRLSKISSSTHNPLDCVQFSLPGRVTLDGQTLYAVRKLLPPNSYSWSSAVRSFKWPISLCSFLLQILERVLDVHIRASIDPALLSSSQQAYTRGKSVETASHSLIPRMERSMHHRPLPSFWTLRVRIITCNQLTLD